MRKWILIFALLAAAVYFLPRFASTEWIKKKLEARLQSQLGGNVKIEKITLQWSSEQSCHQLEWTDPKNGIVFHVDQMVIKAPLVDCLRYREKPLDIIAFGAQTSFKGNLKLIKKKNKAFEIHFSPIQARVEKGVITFSQIEMDINESIKVFTWGKIDLQKSRMNLTLGLPPKTLKKLFKAKDLPEDFLLEIPLSCKLNGRSMERKLLAYFLKNPSLYSLFL
ncbi:MAG: hypothetical protein K1000chlam2_00427 [Chlamydiae bacterium]|nr:hypothetical protein [Chlamydiota bacterium]